MIKKGSDFTLNVGFTQAVLYNHLGESPRGNDLSIVMLGQGLSEKKGKQTDFGLVYGGLSH